MTQLAVTAYESPLGLSGTTTESVSSALGLQPAIGDKEILTTTVLALQGICPLLNKRCRPHFDFVQDSHQFIDPFNAEHGLWPRDVDADRKRQILANDVFVNLFAQTITFRAKKILHNFLRA